MGKDIAASGRQKYGMTYTYFLKFFEVGNVSHFIRSSEDGLKILPAFVDIRPNAGNRHADSG